MKIVLKLLAVIAALVGLFLTAVIVVALVKLGGGNYKLKPAFAGFVVADIVLWVAAVSMWRRSNAPELGTART